MSAAVSTPLVRERPILFSGAMVRALLDGRKTVTRRIVKLPPAPNHLGSWEPTTVGGDGVFDASGVPVPERPAIWHTRTAAVFGCPHGFVGDRLWVRETHTVVPASAYAASREEDGSQVPHRVSPDGADWAIYREGWSRSTGGTRWKPSIFMRRWSSRISLEIVDVRAERLQAITDDDVRAEGITEAAVAELLGKPVVAGSTPRDLWRLGWNAINGKRASYESNPFVWRIAFRRLP